MKLTFRKWLSYQRKKQPPVVEADLTGKTVLVLGASTGLGLEAATHFARMGAGRLILACRSESRGKAAVETFFPEVKTATSFANTIELWLVDLADFTSLKRFADRWDQEGGSMAVVTGQNPSFMNESSVKT
uniref:Short-chain dehydrogenase/reductase family protein n=1 Tax=Mycena chlorophos TaxID=658473 RepID=A0ABQ0L7V7_MYCCL|nr:short-chain dehydrogenase/reductase family protein [Mycena chlorophos]